MRADNTDLDIQAERLVLGQLLDRSKPLKQGDLHAALTGKVAADRTDAAVASLERARVLRIESAGLRLTAPLQRLEALDMVHP
jgi:hypothetical protein